MNILYFDEKELWSPTLSDMLYEQDTTTETVSISRNLKIQGKQMLISVAPADHPSDKTTIQIGEEYVKLQVKPNISLERRFLTCIRK